MRIKETAGNAASALNSENVTAVGILQVSRSGHRGASAKTQRNFAKSHNIDPTLVFETWQELHAASAETIQTVGKRLADAVIVAVQDHMHLKVTLAFAEQGYHILCEKPMATSIDDCLRMEAAVKKAGIIFGMGHGNISATTETEILSPVLSSSVFALQQGTQRNHPLRLARPTDQCRHMEPVGHYHFAHSFVRHFKKSEKPLAPGTRCDARMPVENDCPYSAKKTHGNTGWPAETIVDGVPDIESITNALQNGPYGKCVYESDNDVCDHQVVNIEFSDGSTVSFTMVAFTSLICERQTRFHFSHGEIVGNMRNFTVTDFRKDTSKVYNPTKKRWSWRRDLGLISSFIRAVREGGRRYWERTLGDTAQSSDSVCCRGKSQKGRYH
ncbi:oxidoreductase YteT [Salix suchowensis]|nr:oxidoreductase YteT [Salix suchowensis]